MNIKTTFPYLIREIENTFIPLADGTKLAARIWLPADAKQNPVPAILEYIPYRKNDGTALRDSIRHPYVAGHGYACVRVDMRGSGDSDGLLLDEYLPQEQDDALEVLNWIAEQPWCSGNVGIIGKSWGGFNGLQIAARRPPQLKAIITVASTDDRYADDVHYMGGCLLAADMLPWASTMLLHNAKPPDPKFVGERWREIWLNRLENTPPFVEAWIAHQRRDGFWKHGSVCEPGRFVNRPYDDIQCAVYAVGGWMDAYTNAIPRLLAGLTCPRKGLIGPWSHNYPEEGVPGPAMGFQQDCLRWWDYWLKGIDTGIMDEPMLRSYILDGIPPASHHAHWPGKWVADTTWPPLSVSSLRLSVNGHGLSKQPTPEAPLTLLGDQANGLDSGVWCAYGIPGDLPPDQRADDGLSLCFDSEPLDVSFDLLGFPEVTFTVAVDQPNALLAVRLCDVAPTGASALITRGLLNLTHRESHEQPTPVEPGERYTVTLKLNAIGYSMPKGHKLRLAVSPTYWPFAWPSPKPVTLTVFTGGESRLALPIRSPQAADAELKPFEEPEVSPPLVRQVLRAPTRTRTVQRDVISGAYTLINHEDAGGFRYPDELEYDTTSTDTYIIVEDDPLSATVRCDRSARLGRGEWRTRIETSSVMTAEATTFRVTTVVEAFEGNTRVFSKTRTFTAPREMV